MAINEDFVLSTPSNRSDDDIPSVNSYADLSLLHKYIEEKEVVRNKVNWGQLAPFEQLNNVTDETNTNRNTKEEIMITELAIETGATLINGADADGFTEDQLIGLIKGENEKIEALKAVTTESEYINTKIEACEGNIGLLIGILDSIDD